MNLEIPQALYEKVLERQVMAFVGGLSADELASRVNAEAMDLLSQIKAILDDDAADDPACFRRIDAIARAFWAKGVYTPRHDW